MEFQSQLEVRRKKFVHLQPGYFVEFLAELTRSSLYCAGDPSLVSSCSSCRSDPSTNSVGIFCHVSPDNFFDIFQFFGIQMLYSKFHSREGSLSLRSSLAKGPSKFCLKYEQFYNPIF